MVPGAKHHTSVLDLICFGTNHLNRVILILKPLISDLCDPQMGTQWMITAAHCVHDSKKDEDDVIELLAANSLSVMLGLHDKNKKKEEMRWLDWK